MITNLFDVTIAHYHNLNEVNLDEITKADIVLCQKYQADGIYHPESIRWLGEVGSVDPGDFIFSSSLQKELPQIEAYFPDHGYEIKIKEINEAEFEQFEKLYEQLAESRDRFVMYADRLRVKQNLAVGLPVFLIGLYQGDQLNSGYIAFKQKDRLMVAWSAVASFPDTRYSPSVALIAAMVRFAHQQELTTISFGSGFNPAGVISKTGLYQFKARCGFTAYPEGAWRSFFLLNPAILSADLIFLGITGDQLAQRFLTNTSQDGSAYRTKGIGMVVAESLSEHVTKARKLFGLT